MGEDVIKNNFDKLTVNMHICVGDCDNIVDREILKQLTLEAPAEVKSTSSTPGSTTTSSATGCFWARSRPVRLTFWTGRWVSFNDSSSPNRRIAELA